MNASDPLRRPGYKSGLPLHVPLDLSVAWDRYVRFRVKSVRCLVLGGVEPFLNPHYALPRATGVIELTGHREGQRQTALYIGFSSAAELPAPSFQLTDSDAVGTLSLTPECFTAFMQVATQSGAHFQIGGDGSLNAVATDPSVLQRLAESAGLAAR